jgi:hypothetical protein
LSCGGSFPTYLAGVQTSFRRVAFFVALKSTTLINLVFQRARAPVENFQVGEFKFTLIDNLVDLDVCRYIVRLGEQNYWISFVGIDCDVECGTLPNVDFVHFMWQNISGDFLFR